MTIATSAFVAVGLGNGVTTVWPWAFLIPDAGSVQVIYTDPSGNATVLNPALYSITGLGNPSGGSVTYPLTGSPIANGSSLAIKRNVPLIQPTRLVNQGGYFPEVVEGALDYLEMQIQQVGGNTGKYIQYPVQDVNPVATLPTAAQRANKYFGFDSQGNPAMLAASNLSVDISGNTVTINGVSRTMAARSADIFNVKDYGAKGDGVTDDTTAINACYAAAALSFPAHQVFFPPGIYLVSSIVTQGSYCITMGYGAQIRQKVLAANSGLPIINVTSNTAEIYGLYLYGVATSQPADGFNDSFNAGANGKGRAYRAGIKADVNNGNVILNVRDCYFLYTYGAAVACNGTEVTMSRCYADLCYQELLYLAGTIYGPNVLVTDNKTRNNATGDATVNSYGIFVSSSAGRTLIANNMALNTERCGIYTTGGIDVNVVNNIVDTNTKDNFPGIQVDSTALTTARAIISNNNIFNTGAGIKMSGTNAYLGTILGNQIYTTKGTTTADGISIDQCATCNVSNNALHDIKRHGIDIYGQPLSMIVQSNSVRGQATAASYGLRLNASTGTWPNANVQGNVISNFEGSGAGLGVCNFTRTGAFVFTFFQFKNNTVFSGGAGNYAFRTNGVNIFTNSVIAENSLDGQLQSDATNCRYRGNLVTGTVTLAGGLKNIDITSSVQTTVGAAGGATAQPATPLGYMLVNHNGANVAVAYHNP